MSLKRTEYLDYVYGMVDDRQRQSRVHRSNKPGFIAIIERVLSEYKLQLEFLAAKTGQRPVLKILDVGCGEGLYLHDLAEVLEERGLVEAANLYGIDINQASIATAIEYSQLSRPPRPYLEFYLHDIRQPLTDQHGLFLNNPAPFDFIYARMVLGLLPQAREHLIGLYEALAPGGVLYVRDTLASQSGEDNWLSPHPALNPFMEGFTSTNLRLNQGVDVARAEADWLHQAGANLIQSFPERIELGGETKDGMEALGNLLSAARNASPMLVAQGVMSQVQIDQLMTQLYRELSPQCIGFITYIDTVAAKPT